MHQKSTYLVSGTLPQKELYGPITEREIDLEAEKDIGCLQCCRGVCPGPTGTNESRQYSLEGQKGWHLDAVMRASWLNREKEQIQVLMAMRIKTRAKLPYSVFLGTKGCWGRGVGGQRMLKSIQE